MALAIGYSKANPAPKKCNRKHLLESRIEEPAYYVIDPQHIPYGYDDQSILEASFPGNYPSEMAAAQIRKFF